MNPFFFKGTLRENLLMAKPEANDEELWKALEEMQIKDFFLAQEGLDTKLHEAANNLSGGQRQRIALARAILHDGEFYIFDEAASNIDIESEEIINKRIEKLKEKKTILMISHRLANTSKADRIYVLNKGKIVEEGKHEELINNHGIYAKLFMTQKQLESFGRADL